MVEVADGPRVREGKYLVYIFSLAGKLLPELHHALHRHVLVRLQFLEERGEYVRRIGSMLHGDEWRTSSGCSDQMILVVPGITEAREKTWRRTREAVKVQ